MNVIQNVNPAPPLPNDPTIAASTMSAMVRAIIDDPTQSVTLECRCSPYLHTMG